MDENTKTQFKWKFYRLSVELNVIILLVAASVLVFIIVHSPYTLPLTAGMLIAASIIAFDFSRKYRETKAWLDSNAVKDKENGKESS